MSEVPSNLLRVENISLPSQAGRALGMALIVAGLVGAGAVLGMGFTGAGGLTLKHALAVYHIGAMTVLSITLGGLFFTMVFHLTNAGWAATIRRQCENLAALVPVAWLLVCPVLLIEIMTHGQIFAWLNPKYYSDVVLQKKAVFFYFPASIVDHDTHEPLTRGAFPVFFVLRAMLYLGVWAFLARRLCSLSRRQDETPDPNLSARARFTSAYGILLFALTTAFAAFDWLMSVDFKFFSTMWPVWFFAGAAFSSMAMLVLILGRLRSLGRLDGVVTTEHFHDKGKILFSFTVFWAYISFSQYFLIWYSNIPEETAYFYYRTFKGSPWRTLGILLMVGHFVVPFLIGLFRHVKKTPALLGALAAWCLAMHIADIYFVVRPMVEAGTGETPNILGHLWVDLAAILGLFGVMVGLLIVRIPSLALVPVNDPWMHESLEHRNWV
jgi:hypothetical protein